MVSGSTRVKNQSVELAITKGYIFHYDVLEFIISYVKQVLDAPQVLHEIRNCCEEMMEQFKDLSAHELEYIRHALDTYIPSDDGKGESEKIFVEELKSFDNMTALPMIPESGYTHPMRCMPLGDALQISVWRTTPSFFGARPMHTAYHLSQSCERCDWFISHTWRDNGERKLQMLREHLYLQDLIGLQVITLLLLAVCITPVGFSLTSRWRSFPGWLPSLTFILILVLLLLWTFLSTVNLIPSKFSPWALSQQTVWLDKCCIDQSSPERIKAGVESFDRFLGNCDGMVAFVSSNYFKRVWCVKELATFCKLCKNNTGRKLLLFSLEWPSSLSPFRSSEVTEEEKS